MTDPFEALKKYQTDHLILLVGGNPLPNYVAARVLGKQKAAVHLVHTQQTHRIAQRLAEQLGKPAEHSNLAGEFQTITFVQVDAGNPGDIFAKVKALASQQRGRVGLNYTGGNRPMSVHAYAAVAEARSDAQFSYLDAGRLEMLIHDGSRVPRSFRADQFLNMSLETLFALQGLTESSSKPHNRPIQSELAAALARLHSTPEGAQTWFDWRRKGSAEWTRLPRGQPGLEGVEQVLKKMCGDNPTPDCVAQALGYASLPSSTEWWKSKWLEDHVFAELQKTVQRRDDTRDLSAGVHRVREDHGKRDFDLDIVVMRRYQLFVLSCIVSNNAQQCKDHLMEAYVRARQAGGDEARVGLVCMYKDVQALQAEIASDLDAGGKIRVFGQDDLIPLADRIKEWLDNQP